MNYSLVLTVLSLLAGLAFTGCGGGKSACEAGFDIQVEQCGADPASRDTVIGICEALPEDGVQRCLDCTVAAPDPCTAGDVGGPCESVCTFTVE